MKLNFIPDPNIKRSTADELILTGDYEVKITEIEYRKTSDSEALVLTLQICTGLYKNHCLWKMLYLVHPDSGFVTRTFAELSMLCRIHGITGELNTDDLLDKPMVCRIFNTKVKNGFPTRNSATNFRDLNGLFPPEASYAVNEERPS